MATRVVDFVPTQYEGYARHLSGDNDFWGPPNFQARFWMRNSNQIIYLYGSMRWEEPKADWTIYQLDMTRILYDVRSQHGADWYFVGFRENYDFQLEPQIISGSDGGLKVMYQSGQGMINSLRAVGDRWGGVFGGPDNPRALITFNRVYFTISNDPQAAAVEDAESFASNVEDINISDVK